MRTYLKSSLLTSVMNKIIILLLIFLASCSNISLKKKITRDAPLRLGVLGFRITAPLKELKDIDSSPEGKVLQDEILKREIEAKKFFFQYFHSYYKDIELVDVPIDSVKWENGLKISKSDLKLLKEMYALDGLLLGEIPWYGKTNLLWPTIGFTADILIETLVIGVVTKWNGPLIVANLGWEVVTNGPIWFGGAWLFGQAYKPVTIETKLVTFKDGIHEDKEEFDVTKSQHMLEKYPKKERKKVENQLDASLKKALKHIAIEINED